ncbi:hypothetical protein Cfor_05615 [Coptotermes formosanus]|uniref:Uncharacterized protein n=2 Tax=Coptotermes formosanus TaxID=36987 RepID=A0A6L2PPK4_COPFO|nr:hypothetical protein Cfor_05615 [Coptotermes formosanus]
MLMVYGSSKASQADILSNTHTLHHNLFFTLTPEQDSAVSVLDPIITEKGCKLGITVYRNPTPTDMTLRTTSSHPPEHTMAAYRAIVHRMQNLPLSEAHRKAELDTIMYMEKQSGFSSR